MKYKFICERHEDYGTLGWRLLSRPNYDPLAGMAVAHDVLEHPTNDRGDATGELMAFGAMHLVRGEEYYSQKDYRNVSLAYHQSQELLDMLYRVLRKEEASIWVTNVSERCAVDEEIAETMRAVEALYIAEELNEPSEVELTEYTLRQCRQWMTEGYRRACKRFRGVDRHDLLQAFCEIELEADKALEEAPEGCELTVSLTMKSATITDRRYPIVKVTTNYNY